MKTLSDVPGITMAAIDVGSNAFHLLVSRVDPAGAIWTQHRSSSYVRLGSETLIDGNIGGAVFERALRALARMRNVARQYHPEIWRCVATSAVREAMNGSALLAVARDELGLEIQTIPEEEEARLIYSAASAGLDHRVERMTVVDVGGGSTKMVLGEGSHALLAASLRVGTLRLRDQWDLSDPPAQPQLSLMAEWVRTAIRPVAGRYRTAGFNTLVFTSGAALALARMVGRPLPTSGSAQHYLLPLEKLHAFEHDLDGTKIRERLARRAPEEAHRADHIVEAALIVRTIMQLLHVNDAVVSTAALRDGLVLDAAQALRKAAPEPPLHVAAASSAPHAIA